MSDNLPVKRPRIKVLDPATRRDDYPLLDKMFTIQPPLKLGGYGLKLKPKGKGVFEAVPNDC